MLICGKKFGFESSGDRLSPLFDLGSIGDLGFEFECRFDLISTATTGYMTHSFELSLGV